MSDKGIDITGIDKGELLAALHNGTRPLGMGYLHDIGRPMTKDEGAKIVADQNGWFDYVCGRPIKVRFNGDTLEHAWLYDRDAGEGKCELIVAELRKKAA